MYRSPERSPQDSRDEFFCTVPRPHFLGRALIWPGCILGDPGAVSRVDKMFVVKVYCKIETSPWALTLTEPVPEAFELPASDQSSISEEKLPGDSRVLLHDVVFLIDRHSCVARSTGKVSEQNVNNPQNCNL